MAIHNKCIERGYFDVNGYTLTETGFNAFKEMGIKPDSSSSKRCFACACPDWSERQMHLGGQLGKLLLGFVIQNSWFEKQIESRELKITPRGHKE